MIKRIKLFLLQINYKNLLIALIGSAIIAFGTHIHADADIPEGGIIGLSLIIENLFGFSYIAVNLLINAAFCLLAWRLMGTRYMFNVAIATVGFSFFSFLFSKTLPVDIFFNPETEKHYLLLAALVGSVFIEIGTGLTLRYGSAPNGDHALSMALVKKGGLDFGWVNFLRDFSVILFSLTYTDIYSVAFALLIMTVTNPITEYIVKMPSKRSTYKSDIKRINEKITHKLEMEERSAKETKSGIVFRSVISLVVVAVLLISMAFLGNPHKANDDLINSFVTENVTVKELDEDGSLVAYVPEGEIKGGFVFYPGALVEPEAYDPLLRACAEKGVVSILVKMPYNLAFFGVNKGVSVTDYFPDVENWYIGGHSLGGAMASSCASTHKDAFKGVVLLAAYSINDITDLRVLSVYGNKDQVMNMAKYLQNKINLPGDLTEVVIKDGNHSYFGMYVGQDSAMSSLITNESQIRQTAQHIYDFITE